MRRLPTDGLEELDKSIISSKQSSGGNQTQVYNKESIVHSEGSSSESFFKKSEFLDPLVKINTLKYMTSNDLKVSANVKFALLDLRHMKRPKLADIFKQVTKKMGQKVNVPVIEIATTSKTTPTLAQVC
jgi:hypothetical protein